jgi:2-dehydro-3-deoxygluconokinase
MERASVDLVALGEPLVEFNQTRGSANQYLQGFGGDTSNCVIAVARLGLRTAYITRLGSDAFGRMFLDLWRHEGVDTQGVGIDADARTGVYFVTHAAAGHEFSYLRAGSAASRMRPADLPLDLIRTSKVLHVSGISQAISERACDTAFTAIEAAREAGTKISYDPNLRLKLWTLARARAVIVGTIPLCDWFLPSLEEAEQLSGLSEPQALLDWCHTRGAPVVALKMGADGAWVSTATMRQHVPGHRMACVDTTGAGDCFDGAFAARLIAGDTPLAAARYANAAAALKTLGYGAVAPLPRDHEVKAFLARPSSP